MMSQLRQGKLTSDPQKAAPSSSYVAIDLLYHISSFSKILAAADILDTIGTPVEKAAFAELKSLTLTMMNSAPNEPINMHPFLEKLSAWTSVDYCKVDDNDILCVWDDIVKLIMVVIPPLREVFLGQVSSNLEVPGWLNLMSRCFHAHFTESAMSLEEVYLNSLTSSPSSAVLHAAPPENGYEQQTASVLVTNNAATAEDKLRIANAMVLRRAPEILVISVESVHLYSHKSSHHAAASIKGPSSIRYPETFDLALFSPGNHNSQNINANNSAGSSKIYDISAVVALEGAALDNLQTYFRIIGEEQEERWYRGAGFTCEEVSKSRAIEGNFFGSTLENRIHPRLLVYTRRDLPLVLERTLHLVSKAGQMRALGDLAFAAAMTTENYGDARRCYEEAIALDESLRVALQENLSSLEKIERTQRARVLEEQADLALANKRFREAGELYAKGMMNAVVSSGVYLRVRNKIESLTHIIALDTACKLAEKGEEALLLGLLPTAKDLYSQAFKLNPEFLHLHTILVGIEKTVQMLTAGQRIADAQTAAKAYHYKLANHFYREAIAFVPEKLAGLQATLDSLAPLMQGEDALMRQKLGLAALEDKRYVTAIQLFTEAIGLLPMTQASCLEHAVFLCDRALAHYDLKDFNKAVTDCSAALELKPELAIAHFRLGAAQFSLDQFDLASTSYDKALKCDPSLSESIKVKVRQVTTAKEIQQRKQRETERAKEKEEEKKLLDEKRARDELLKKEKAEKLAVEQAIKAERNKVKEEEKRAKAAVEKETEIQREKEKEVEKERLRLEKIERDIQKVAERERVRLEKEKERERLRIEKEQRAIDSRKAQDEEKRKQIEFTAELERNAARRRELEREKEIEKEKARIEREKLVIEREKARQEKLEMEAARALLVVIPVPVPEPVPTPVPTPAPAPVAVAELIIPKAPKSEAIVKVATVRSSPHTSDGPGIITILKRDPSAQLGTGPSLLGFSGSGNHVVRESLTQPAQTLSAPQPALSVYTSDQLMKDFKGGVGVLNSPSSGLMGNSKVWTASKSSADTITRTPNFSLSSSSSQSKRLLPFGDIITEFLTPTEVSPAQNPKANGLNDSTELGWSVKRTSPIKDQDIIATNSSSLSSTNDIFSSMADRPAMSTDYTFKPSERTMKAAEAKRLADSQQKAAAAAAAANPFSDTSRGDFDEFLSSSSASYISNFSSSIRFTPTFASESSPSNGLFFTTNSSSSSSSPGMHTGYSESPNLSDNFSSSFSGLGFSSTYLSSAAAAAPSSGDLGGLRGSSTQPSTFSSSDGFAGILSHSQAPRNVDDIEDDFGSGYFSNPLRNLGGLDLDDTIDPLLLAIGGLGMPTPFVDPLPSSNKLSPSAVLQSPQRPASSQSLPHHSSPLRTISGENQMYNSLSSFSTSSSPIRSVYNGQSGNSSSPSFSLKSEYGHISTSQRPFPSGVNQEVKKRLSSSAFSSIGSIGSTTLNSRNNTGMENYRSNVAENGTNGVQVDYFNEGLRDSHRVGPPPPIGPQPPHLHSMSMLFPSQISPTTPDGLLSSNTRSGDADSRDRIPLSQIYPVPPSVISNDPLSNFLLRAPSSSSAPIGLDGIEADILPESAFVSVAWLRQHGMHMYRWAGNASEWTEYAMHLPPNIVPFFNPGSTNFTSLLPELQSSGCKIWVDKENLKGREAVFLVFLRGAAGQPSNVSMNLALDILSNKMRAILPQIRSHSQSSFGSIGGNRGSPLPSQFGVSNMGMHFAQPLPHTAWGTGGGASFLNVGGIDAGLVARQSTDEEDRDTMSDEYYDPEDLARSLPSEGADTNSDWSTAPIKRSTLRRPESLRVLTLPGGYVQRWLVIPRDSVGLVIGQGGKKIKDLCTLSGAKIQFRVNKTAEREGRPGLLELHGAAENVDAGLQLVWDLLHHLGKEYQEIPVQRYK